MNSRSSVNDCIRLIFGLISLQVLVYCMMFHPLILAEYSKAQYLDTPTVATGRAEETSIQPRQQQSPLGLDFNFNMSDFKLLFLHVGKTGGKSLDKILRSNCDYKRDKEKKNRCYEELCCTEDELLLSKVTSRTLHMYIPRKQVTKKYKNHQLLWTLRNPIDRLVSALDMRANHVYSTKLDFWADVFFRQCGFQTVQDLADAMEFAYHNNSTSKASPKVIRIPRDGKVNGTEMIDFDCHKFGKATIGAKKRDGDKGHANMGYAHYSLVNKLLPNKKIFALRTEFLWDDVIQTNELLVRAAASQQNHQHSLPSKINDAWISDVKGILSHRFTHGSESWEIKSKLTKRGKEIICCFLSGENRIYEKLLLRAVNLSDQQKRQSLESLYRDCGIQETTTFSRNNGFNWKKWRKNGCPTKDLQGTS